MTDLSRTQQTKRKQRQADLLAMLEAPFGRRFLCDLMEQCGYSDALMGSNTAENLHRLSRRTVAVQVIDDLHGVDEHALIKLLAEAATQRTKHVQPVEARDEE